MSGYITEKDLDQADEAFPGIKAFFEGLREKPLTFLELVALFGHWCESGRELAAAA
jgi:hypothetical protein